MVRELTAPEALAFYRETRDGSRAFLARYCGAMIASNPLTRLQKVRATEQALQLWAPLVEFLLKNSEAAGVTPADLYSLLNDEDIIRQIRDRIKAYT